MRASSAAADLVTKQVTKGRGDAVGHQRTVAPAAHHAWELTIESRARALDDLNGGDAALRRNAQPQHGGVGLASASQRERQLDAVALGVGIDQQLTASDARRHDLGSSRFWRRRWRWSADPTA